MDSSSYVFFCLELLKSQSDLKVGPSPVYNKDLKLILCENDKTEISQYQVSFKTPRQLLCCGDLMAPDRRLRCKIDSDSFHMAYSRYTFSYGFGLGI